MHRCEADFSPDPQLGLLSCSYLNISTVTGGQTHLKGAARMPGSGSWLQSKAQTHLGYGGGPAGDLRLIAILGRLSTSRWSPVARQPGRLGYHGSIAPPPSSISSLICGWGDSANSQRAPLGIGSPQQGPQLEVHIPLPPLSGLVLSPAVLLDERSRPDFRGVFGHMA